MSSTPIGMFDSGVGGLSVMRYVLYQMPQESVVYVADQAYMPYGQKSAELVRERSRRITEFLLNEHNCKLIVIPCNTATAAALTYLREQFPDVDFVGMEPAMKPGARASKSGMVGVLATEGTFDSERYEALTERFASGVQVFEDPCIGLVELIEAGKGESEACARLLRPILEPMLAKGVDTLVLGCTHYPFAIHTIRRIVGDSVVIIDPAPAVVRQAHRVLSVNEMLNESSQRGDIQITSTGRLDRFAIQTQALIGADLSGPLTQIPAFDAAPQLAI